MISRHELEMALSAVSMSATLRTRDRPYLFLLAGVGQAAGDSLFFRR